MSFSGIKKSPLISLPFLKKRLRRITGLGLRNLTVNELNFQVHFTLHRTDKTVAFYTSELVENQRSPEWSYLVFPTNVQCLEDFVLRIWITTSNNCRLFLEYDIHLDDSLIPDDQKDDLIRRNNSLWLEMFGYRFSDSESIANNQNSSQLIDINTIMLEKKSKRIHFVRSYNQLSLLRMLRVLNDIRSKKQQSTESLQCLQTFFNEHEDYFSKRKEREARRIRVANLKQFVLTHTSMYERRSNSNEYRQKSVNERKTRLEQNLLQLLNQQEELNSSINHLNESKCLLHDIMQLITLRQKEMISEIYSHVYPIVHDHQNEYSIADIKLPPAEDKIYQTSMTREREFEIEAAVGYCAHIVLLIAQFIQLPLRFPIEYYATPTIKIHDLSLQITDFPLYPSYDPNTFQYGLFLLNRNIGQIMHHCRIVRRQPDYRKTLENLKDLMEQYFLNIDNKNPIQLYGLNPQSTESKNPMNDKIHSDRSSLVTRRHSTVNSLFSPTRSATSSILETTDEEQHDDANNNVDLFPRSNTISPRLIMQFSQQQ